MDQVGFGSVDNLTAESFDIDGKDLVAGSKIAIKLESTIWIAAFKDARVSETRMKVPASRATNGRLIFVRFKDAAILIQLGLFLDSAKKLGMR